MDSVSSPPSSTSSQSTAETDSVDSSTPYHLPHPLSRAHLYNNYHPGDLHLVPCTLEQFVDLPWHNEDRYDLVEGILVWQSDMPDREHEKILSSLFGELYRHHCTAPTSDSTIVLSSPMLVPPPQRRIITRQCSENERSSSGRFDSVRRPDLAIGDRIFQEGRGNESPTSAKLMFPRGHPPKLALEVTSTPNARKVDVEEKPVEYERARVKTYVIVDRDLPGRLNEKVIVMTLSTTRRGPSYSETVYTGNQIVQCPFFNELQFSANRILHPQRTMEEALNSPLRNAERRADSAERRADSAERGRGEAEQETERERRRADSAERGRGEAEQETERERRRADSAERGREEAERQNADLRRQLQARNDRERETWRSDGFPSELGRRQTAVTPRAEARTTGSASRSERYSQPSASGSAVRPVSPPRAPRNTARGSSTPSPTKSPEKKKHRSGRSSGTRKEGRSRR